MFLQQITKKLTEKKHWKYIVVQRFILIVCNNDVVFEHTDKFIFMQHIL